MTGQLLLICKLPGTVARLYAKTKWIGRPGLRLVLIPKTVEGIRLAETIVNRYRTVESFMLNVEREFRNSAEMLEFVDGKMAENAAHPFLRR